MLHVQLALFKATAISALSLQLSQPIIPAGPGSAGFPTSSDGAQTVNASFLSNSSYTLAEQSDGLIALPPNGPDRSFTYYSENDSSQASNKIYMPTFDVSSVSQPPHPLFSPSPLPHGWRLTCSEGLGTGLNYQSCSEAWGLFPATERRTTFRSRQTASRNDIGLPKRYISCTSRPPFYIFLAAVPIIGLDRMLMIWSSRWEMLRRAFDYAWPD